MKASDLLVKTLENEGVEYIFGVPGEENLDFLESLRTSGKIKFILTRHEQSAGFMAATVGRLTGKVGVCLATLGPGATNLVTAAAFANLGGFPMMMITGQKPMKETKQGLFQIVDIVQMFQPITKFSKRVIHANLIPAYIHDAFRIATQEHPGAVHIELPEDTAREEVADDSFIFPIHRIRRPNADEKSVLEAVEMIHKAKRPLICIGAGANRKVVSKMLNQFLEKTQIPFFNTQMGKGVVGSNHDNLFLGTAALSDGDYLHCAIEKADLIINIGHDVVEKPPFIMHKNGYKVIHINFSQADINDYYFPQLEVIGDIADALWQMTEKIKSQKSWDLKPFFRIQKDILSHIEEKKDSLSFPVIPQKFVSAVQEALPSDGILSLDNGIYKIWFARNFSAQEPNSLLLDNALATMGAGLPSAIAAKILKPEKKVLAICGDGGFMMNSQELETAIRLKLDLVLLILNDSAFGMIKWKQEGMGFENFSLDYKNPNFVKYAESYGAMGHFISKTEDLVPTLKKALNSKGVHVIECPVDYSENAKVLIDELKKKTCVL